MYERACQNMAMSLRNVQRQWEFAFIGAPFDAYLQSDLRSSSFKGERYKLFIFPNNVLFDERERESVDRIIKRDGKVVLWEWAPGFISDKGVGTENIHDLMGIKVDCERAERHSHIDVVNYKHPFTRDLPLGHCFGPEISKWHLTLFKESGFMEDDPSFKLGPLFYCSDPEATTLGVLNSTGKSGWCVKRFEGWTSTFVATPFVSKDVLRNVAKYAGVHLYSDRGDLVYSNKHFLSICPRFDGKRIIRLPEPRDVTDLWSGQKFAEDAESLEIDAIANRTYMYLMD